MNILYIDGVAVEVNDRLAITLTGINVNDLTSRSVNYSNKILIPWTNTTRIIFGLAEHIQSTSSLMYTKFRCRYVQDGFELIPDGFCWVLGVNDAGVTVAIFENTVDVFDAIKGLKIRDLNYLTPSGWNAADIDSARLNTTGVLNAIVNYGRGNGGLVYNVNYWLPCFFYHDWVRESLERTGLTITGDITTDNDFLNLVCPYPHTEWAYPENLNIEYSLYAPYAFPEGSLASTTTDGATEFPVKVNLNGGSTTNWIEDGDEIYLVDTGRGSLRWLNLSITVSPQNLSIVSWNPGDIVTFQFEVYHPTEGYTYQWTLVADENVLGPSPVFGGTTLSGSATQNVVIGDGARIRCYVDPGLSSTGVQMGPDTNPAVFSFVGTSPTTVNRTTVLWNLLLPEIDCTDIVKDFATRFGAVFKQVEGDLEIGLIQDIINDKTNAVDWTGKRTKKRDEISYDPGSYGQITRFIYDKDSGSGIQPDESAGMGQFVISNEILEPQVDLFRSPFEVGQDMVYQVNTMYQAVYDSTSSDIADFKRSNGPRLGVIRSRSGAEPNMTFNVSARSDYKIVSFEYNATGTSQVAGFQYYIDNYHSNLINALNNYKMIKREYYLTQYDIYTFDRFRLVYDDGAYFIVVKIIDFVPGKPTKVQMLMV